MVEFGYLALLTTCLIAAGYVLVLALLRRDPSWFSVGAAGVVELALVIQLVASIFMVVGGAGAKGDTVEYFGYIITALLVPPASVVWAMIERTKWSTLVIALACLTVAVMAVRMWQIWSGNVFHF